MKENEALNFMELFEDKGFFNNENISDNVPNIKVMPEIQIIVSDKPTQKKCAAESIIDKLLKKWYNLSDYDTGLRCSCVDILFLMWIIFTRIITSSSVKKAALGFFILSLIISLFIMTGEYFSARIYSSRRGIRYGKTMYSVDYNNNVIKLKVAGSHFDSEKLMVKCNSMETSDCYHNFFYVPENEIFEDWTAAALTAEEIKKMRVSALSGASVLNDKDKALKFLDSLLYRKYAEFYYKKQEWDHSGSCCVSAYEFLMSRQSFLNFCQYIKEEETIREKNEHEKKMSENNDNKLIKEIENLI